MITFKFLVSRFSICLLYIFRLILVTIWHCWQYATTFYNISSALAALSQRITYSMYLSFSVSRFHQADAENISKICYIPCHDQIIKCLECDLDIVTTTKRYVGSDIRGWVKKYIERRICCSSSPYISSLFFNAIPLNLNALSPFVFATVYVFDSLLLKPCLCSSL